MWRTAQTKFMLTNICKGKSLLYVAATLTEVTIHLTDLLESLHLGVEQSYGGHINKGMRQHAESPVAWHVVNLCEEAHHSAQQRHLYISCSQ